MQELSWIFTAIAAAWLAQLVQLPVFVGYLLAGFVLALLGQEPSNLLHAAGHIGVILLLFSVGLHLRIRDLLRREVLLTGVLHLSIGCGLFIAAALLLGVAVQTALFLGAVLSFSSTVLAAKELERRNELTTYHGRIVIGILILQDVVAVALMMFAGNEPFHWALLLLLPALFLARKPLLAFIQTLKDPDLSLLTGLAIVLGVAELFDALGASAELGAVIIGALLAGDRQVDRIGERLWGVKSLLLGAFFLEVGMAGWPEPEVWIWLIPLLLILPAKALLFYCLFSAVKLSPRTAFLSSTALTSYSEFTLIAGAVGLQQGLIPPEAMQLLAVVTICAFVLYLPVNRLNYAIYDRVEPWLKRWQPFEQQPDKPAKTFGAARYLVVGMGRTGIAAFKWFRQSGHPTVGIDGDPRVVSKHLGSGHRCVYGDALDKEFWLKLQLSGIDTILVCLNNAEARLRAVKLIRAASATVRISAFALDAEERQNLQYAGADQISSPQQDAGERLAELSSMTIHKLDS